MEMENVEVQLTENLLMLERGKEELLLANSFDLQPLYIKRGRVHIQRLLTSAPELHTLARIQEAFPADAQLIRMLYEHRVLVDKGSERKGCSPDACCGKSARGDRSAISLYLLLTQSCNLGCIYCLNGRRSYKAEKLVMSEEIACRAVESCLASLNSGGRLEIAFFGGEPLLNWPLAKQVIRHCEETLKPRHPGKEIQYHLTSNLTFLPDDLIDWAKRHSISFLCDIDGPPEIHDRCRPYKGGRPSCKDTTEHVRRIIDAGLSVSLRATVTSINQHCMAETAACHRALGGRGSAFVPVSPVNSDEDILTDDLLPSPEILIRGLEEMYRAKTWDSSRLFPFSIYSSKIQPGTKTVMGCGAPYGNTPVVDVHGGVYPCIYLVGISRFYLGNLLKGDYPNEGVLDRMMEQLHVENLAECRECPWRYLCGGGCPVGRLTILDNPAVTPKVKEYCGKINCDYNQAVLELLFWELAQEALLSIERGEDAPRKAPAGVDRASVTNC